MTNRLKFFAGRRLFLRIFVRFWFATIVLFVAYVLASITLRPAWGVAGRVLFSYLGVQAADEYEARGTAGSAAFLSALERRTHFQAYLLSKSGGSLLLMILSISATLAGAEDDRYKADVLLVVAYPDDDVVIGGYLAQFALDAHKRIAVAYTTTGHGGG
jgi:hypothetical protein